ncbi:hypothetical protein FSARC_5565 [Fusarium sarcochroum]|uniref:Ankyrin n=1 Tax=Fusarium sarcochroum TaxID=1208366 RepID=A0A8H4TZ36_9HYPO|nr:hypothetical protein FSARC_5565 [Fusarium sarcochroum]
MNSQNPHPEAQGLLGLPVEIMGLIMKEIELLPEPYKQLLQFAKTCRALAAQAIPQLYYKDATESLKLTQDQDMPIALQWACWYGVLGTAKSSLEALGRTVTDTDVTQKISQPFNNDNLYHLRYKTVKRRGPSGPAYCYLHWGSKSGLLHLACLRGNTAIAKMLMDKGAHPDTPDGKNLPALAYALNEDVAQLLIDYGADINVTHGTDETALCHLISWGPMEDVDWNKEFNMPRGDGALTPLHTRHDHLSTIKLLIQNPKTDIYADRIKNVSPLQLAVTRRYVEAVELLLDAGASPNPIHSEGGKRLLLTDALKRIENSPIIRMLLDAGAEADLEHMPEGGLSEEQGSDLPIMNLTSSGSNPLYAREEVEIARLVCKKIKHFDANMGEHPALWHYVRRGRGDIGQVLIQAGADPEVANVEVRDTVLGLIAH